MFLEKGEINPAHPIVVTATINPRLNEFKDIVFSALRSASRFPIMLLVSFLFVNWIFSVE